MFEEVVFWRVWRARWWDWMAERAAETQAGLRGRWEGSEEDGKEEEEVDEGGSFR